MGATRPRHGRRDHRDELPRPRHRTHSVLSLATTTLRAGDRPDTPVRVAAPTRALGTDPVAQKQTFHGQPAADLTRVLGALDTLGRRHLSFAGVSVHDYTGWSQLRP